MAYTTISIVIPVFNNSSSIAKTVEYTVNSLESVNDIGYEIILVNDGSTDDSWSVLQELHLTYSGSIMLINLEKNFGQINALLAGYVHAAGDAIISMAADMQDPPALIPQFISAWREGHRLVIARRVDRNDGRFTDFTSGVAWFLLNYFAHPNLPKGGFDFYLMDRRVRDHYVSNPEHNIFMQGRLYILFARLIPLIMSEGFEKGGYRKQVS